MLYYAKGSSWWKKVLFNIFLNIFVLRKNGSTKYCSLKCSLENPKWLFCGIVVKTPFWNFYLRVWHHCEDPIPIWIVLMTFCHSLPLWIVLTLPEQQSQSIIDWESFAWLKNNTLIVSLSFSTLPGLKLEEMEYSRVGKGRTDVKYGVRETYSERQKMTCMAGS